MKKKVLIIICIIWILLEVYLIVNNYLKENPITTNVVLLVGFLGTLYLISGKDNVVVKKKSESPKVKKNENK